MSGEGAFMWFNGRRVEWEQIHPAFKAIFAFNIHGPGLCIDLGVHPMFPMSWEIDAIAAEIRRREEALV
jgi:hypothetical protein